MGTDKDFSEISELDFSALSEANRNSLHRLLYRQECRVWILAMVSLVGLKILFASIDSSKDDVGQTYYQWYAFLVAIFLSFWVAWPSNKILSNLRQNIDKLERAKIERGFDFTLHSLWDFAPFLLVLIPFIGALIFKLLMIV